jgi:hypothetical protein
LAYVAAVIGPFAIPMLYCVAAISAFRKMIHPKKPDATISHREFPRCTLSGPRSTTAVRPYIEPFISEGRDIRRVRRPDRPAIAAQWSARIAAVIAPDPRFAYFDQKIVGGVPMTLKRVANILNTDATLFQEFRDRFSKYGDRTLTLFADGRLVEVPVF